MPLSQADADMSNGQDGHAHPPASLKKGKQKKAVDSNESAKLLAQRISQLEQESAGEKDQEAEIGAYRLPSCLTPPEAGGAESRVWSLEYSKSYGHDDHGHGHGHDQAGVSFAGGSWVLFLQWRG